MQLVVRPALPPHSLTMATVLLRKQRVLTPGCMSVSLFSQPSGPSVPFILQVKRQLDFSFGTSFGQSKMVSHHVLGGQVTHFPLHLQHPNYSHHWPSWSLGSSLNRRGIQKGTLRSQKEPEF